MYFTIIVPLVSALVKLNSVKREKTTNTEILGVDYIAIEILDYWN